MGPPSAPYPQELVTWDLCSPQRLVPIIILSRVSGQSSLVDEGVHNNMSTEEKNELLGMVRPPRGI